MIEFGLIGFPLTHSFSKKYFSEKFDRENISNVSYELFPIGDISELPDLITDRPMLKGINVTIPYKEKIIPFLDELDESADFGAVNTVVIDNGKLIGYNTDVYGFHVSLTNFFKSASDEQSASKALVLGSGGASKAVTYVLKKLGFQLKVVSRNPTEDQITYEQIDNDLLQSHRLIINTTPLGTYPDIDACPKIPYQLLSSDHLMFDLVYNPEKSLFLKKGQERGASIKNGYEMLVLQAEKAWEIWTSDNNSQKQEMVHNPSTKVDFSNTEIAFSSKSNQELKKAAWLFGMMNSPTLVKVGSAMGLMAFNLKLPVGPLVKRTIYDHFCGGRTLKEVKNTVDLLAEHNVLTMLDYGAEGKNTEKDFNIVMERIVAAIEFADGNDNVPVISCKFSGIVRNEILEKVQEGTKLSARESKEYQNCLDRVEKICATGYKYKVGVFIDAEESWIQDPIDEMANAMMEKYNKESVIVYNTFQLYRHDRLQYLKDSFKQAREKGYYLGAKLVRGAYHVKENLRAEKRGYPTPIQPNKEATDRDYNLGLKFCLENYEEIGLVNATHNEESCRYMADLINEMVLPKAHPHLNFCQLLGMSDHLSFNLAKAGYCVAKYVPFGPIRNVIPYLIRRAQENTSIAGGMSRELGLIKEELKRRKI